VTWKIAVTSTAKRQLTAVRDRRVRTLLRNRIDRLAEDPDKQGKPLVGELMGYRSLRAVGQRYRILYRVENQEVVVVVVALGLRKSGSKKDVYSLAKKLIRLRLLDPGT
jgi:mRNA interferase RelE/StbE